ncbi:MAG: hypothetical protein ABJ092_14795 [Gillisia sp.]
MKNYLIVFVMIGILSSCSTDNADEDMIEFVQGEVIVGIKSGTDINRVFDFINQFDHKVKNIRSLTFTSDLPSDSLQYVIRTLNEKTYTNDGINWFVTGYLHYQTNQITIFPKLFDMDNVDFQNDWLISMEEFDLKTKHYNNLNAGIIHFYVPKGSELEWENRFKNSDIVEWAELNYIQEITHGIN